MALNARGSLEPRTTTSEAVAAVLRAEILAGDHAPGARLRQDEVAARLGVSITPVREAFTQLRAEGMLRSDAHRGVQVFAPTVADLRELYEMRISLERLAIRHAAAHVTPAVLDELDALVREMGDVRDHDRYFEQNKELHTKLYAAARMPRLTELVHTLRDASDVYLHLFVVELTDARMEAIRRASDEDHRAILAACRAGNGDEAEVVLEAHLNHTLASVVELLDAQATKPAAE